MIDTILDLTGRCIKFQFDVLASIQKLEYNLVCYVDDGERLNIFARTGTMTFNLDKPAEEVQSAQDLIDSVPERWTR